jgi:hypothetical protein
MMTKTGVIKITEKAKRIESNEELAEFEKRASAIREKLKKNAKNRADRSRLN